MAFKTDIFIDALSVLMRRSLAFCWYLNFEDFLLLLDHMSFRDGKGSTSPRIKVRGRGIYFPFFLHRAHDIHWRCTLLIQLTAALRADFSSLMMHNCDVVNMTGSLRSNTSVFPSSAVSPLQSVASLADLLTSSHARYSTERSLLL